MADKIMTCRDCGTEFTFTEGEQAFYAQKGFSEPSRCPNCRAAKKAARNNSPYSDGGYGNSNYGNGGYGNNSYGSTSGFNSYGNGNGSNYGNSRGNGGYARPERVMTQVTCANCGKETEVPFVPRGLRPVYCSDCFNQMNAGSSNPGRRY
jgi:CxxC-x17-CxxC domain-containing protein